MHHQLTQCPGHSGPSRTSFLAAASIALLLGVSGAQAAITVTVSAAPGEPAFHLADGITPLPDGMHFQLGSFASIPSAIDAQDNPAELFALWQVFSDGIDDVIVTIGEDSGLALGDLDGDDSFLGQTIYWWAFNTSDGLAPAADFSNVTEHALFTGADGWTFSALPPVVSTSDNLTFFAGEISGGNVTLTAVPEPTLPMLSLFALAPLALRRRR
ncbi:hypothetical protein [Luteolibacter luteus]|uniref:PEP-CTERM sorting domain-containing protein n=1 Tax=Luteolibacter luteus TaxID=2728835 RepID=A0A858RDM6_9BACT|nr:hypothetical protein [Luteolibacter luteus]QJE94499.1 hypothetical protein HHL09_01415 [Luteolibacter luteus]